MKIKLILSPVNQRFRKSGLHFSLFTANALFFIIFILIGFISCSKEKNEDLCSDPTLMREVRMGKDAVQGLTYNSNCQVNELLEPYQYSKFTYNATGRLFKIEVAISLNPLSCVALPGGDGGSSGDPRKAKVTTYYEYEFNGEGIPAKRYMFGLYNNTFQFLSCETYHYTNDLIDTVKVYDQNEILNNYKTYSYENENIKVEKFYTLQQNNDFRLIYAIEYEFDDKFNPFRVLAVMAQPGKYTNTNNIIKETHISNPGTTEIRYSTNYSYEYNERGYPVKINTNDVVYGK